MTQATIPVDALNPGQVFACLGFMEAADVICDGARAGFDWSEASSSRFVLRVSGEENPFEAVLQFLAGASLHTVAPYGSSNSTAPWDVQTEILPPGAAFPYPDPESAATLPVMLTTGSHRLRIDHWGDATRTRDNVKFWAGAAGYPGGALTRDALELARPHLQTAASDPFSVSALQSSSFRFDWRRDYIPIDAGFSLNYHGQRIQSLGYPLVELMAAIGLTHARPLRDQKLLYRYGIAGRATATDPEESALLPPMFVRAALGCVELPFPMRIFRMVLDWPGQEGQARSITSVTEETQ